LIAEEEKEISPNPTMFLGRRKKVVRLLARKQNFATVDFHDGKIRERLRPECGKRSSDACLAELYEPKIENIFGGE